MQRLFWSALIAVPIAAAVDAIRPDPSAEAAAEWQALRAQGQGCVTDCPPTAAAFVPASDTAVLGWVQSAPMPPSMATQLAAMSLVARHGADALPPEVHLYAAAGTASLLGEPAPDSPTWKLDAQARLERLESLRAASAASCGSCVGSSAAPSDTWEAVPRLAQAAERIRRAGLSPDEPPSAAVLAAVTIRAGGALPPGLRAQAGIAGLGALELARQGDVGCVQLADWPAPTPADAVALAYALRRCESGSPP